MKKESILFETIMYGKSLLCLIYDSIQLYFCAVQNIGKKIIKVCGIHITKNFKKPTTSELKHSDIVKCITLYDKNDTFMQ